MSSGDHRMISYGAGAPLRPTFPRYDDGDVRIIITGMRQYQLHSNILKYWCNNGTFDRLLADHLAAPLSVAAISRGITTRHRLDASSHPPGLDGIGIHIILKPIPLNSNGQAILYTPIGLDLENGLIPDPTYEAFDAVLGAIYGRPITLGDFDSSNLTDMLRKALVIVSVAEYMGMVHTVTKPIEADLSTKGQMINRAIVADPACWLSFGFRLKSRLLFREALIHAVGQFNTDGMQRAMAFNLEENILKVIEKKVNILKDGLKKAQMNMIAYYPEQLKRELILGYANTDNIGRSSYANDIFAWISVVVFRHFVAQNVVHDNTHNATDMGYEFFSKLRDGGDNYLSKADLEEFHRTFPMTDKGKSVLEYALNTTKEYVRKWAGHFFVNESQLDINQYPSGYFTNTKVNWDDYVWSHAPLYR